MSLRLLRRAPLPALLRSVRLAPSSLLQLRAQQQRQRSRCRVVQLGSAGAGVFEARAHVAGATSDADAERQRRPGRLQSYLALVRADKPIGTYLLLAPCAWSIALAADAGSLPDLRMLALFTTGAFGMRGAGCIVNDLWDMRIDRLVERTRSRPLASGAVSVPEAVALLGAHLAVGLGVLTQLNMYRCARRVDGARVHARVSRPRVAVSRSAPRRCRSWPCIPP